MSSVSFSRTRPLYECRQLHLELSVLFSHQSSTCTDDACGIPPTSCVQFDYECCSARLARCAGVIRNGLVKVTEADADAMMEQLLAEDMKEKKAKGAANSAKRAKSKKARTRRRH